MIPVPSIVCAISLALVPAGGDEPLWNRFRGPNGAGVCESATLPETLDADTMIVWRTEVPAGFSSPVVGRRDVFLTAAEELALYTFCIDRRSGEVRWRVAAPRALERRSRGPNSPVSSTPTTDGENVYAFFENFGIVSYGPDGKERWRHALDPFNTPYGMGSSPIWVDGLVVMQCDQDLDSYVIALDAATGAQRWRTARPDATHGFSTPIVLHPSEGSAELVLSGSYRVVAYELGTGKELWHVGGMAWQAKSVPVCDDETLYVHSWMASPAELGTARVSASWVDALVSWDDDGDERLSKAELEELRLAQLWFLFDADRDEWLSESEWASVLARFNAPSGLFAIPLAGEGPSRKVAWEFHRSLPNIPSPLLYRDVLYLLKEEGILTALDPASGEVLKAGRVEGAEETYFASPVAADGKLVLASHPGRVTLLSAGADWRVLSVTDLEEEIWATPALAGGSAFVRTQKALYAFEEPEG